MANFLKTIAFQVSDPEFFAEYEKRQKESGLKVKDYFFSLIRTDIAQNQTQEVTSEPEQSGDTQEQTEEAPVPSELSEQTEHADEQSQTDAPAQNEEMMNLFVKIPRNQRVALECHKNQTGETVGNVLNRLIDDFLKYTNEGELPDGYFNTIEKYSGGLHPLDTTASAKIPVKTNQELNNYIESQFESRNTIIAALVDMELNRQEMNEVQDQDSDMGMSM